MASQKRYNLSPEKKKFANAILDGSSKIDAYLEYINSDVTKAEALAKANLLLMGKNLSGYINDKRQLLEDKIRDKQLWTRENSISELKSIIALNKQEQARAAEAIDDEIDFLLHTMEENPEDDKVQERCIKQIIARRQKLRVNKTTNDGILCAVTELNKMHGFNEENVNLYHGQVVFSGEDELED